MTSYYKAANHISFISSQEVSVMASSVENLAVEPARGSSTLKFCSRRSRLEKILLMVSGVALLACAALVGVVASSQSTTAPTPSELKINFPELPHPAAAQKAGITTPAKHEQNDGQNKPAKDERQGIQKKKSTRLPVTKGYDPSGAKYDICNTEECILAAAAIIEAMDKSIEPCDNFFQFACGAWMEKHPVPEASSRWSQFDLLDLELTNALSDILTSPVIVDDPKSINQAKAMYAACMDEDILESVGVTPLTDFLEQYGGWPMTLQSWVETSFDWQVTVADARKLLGQDYLIKVWVFADEKDTYSTAIHIDQSSLGMPRSVLTTPESYEARITAYKEYMATTATIIATALGTSVDPAAIEEEVKATFEFEMALANITTPDEERRDSARMYNDMTVAELNTLTGGFINWQEMLSSMFSTAGISIETNQRVIVQEVEYMQKLTNLIQATSARTVANYLMWRHVQALGDETNKEMRDASFNYEMIVTGISAQKPRSETCAISANDYMGMALGTKYVDAYFSQQAKDEANEMVEDLRSSFKDLLAINEWMDEDTKPKAIEKADAISKFIAYPDWYNNASALESYYSGLDDLEKQNHFSNILKLRNWGSTDELDDFGAPTKRDKWLMTPTTVNAYYEPEFNSITFPAGILQPPFYRANSLQALNYGGIGQVIGHEITHGFDDEGRQYDKDGNTIPWWSNATSDAFKEKAQCIINQYGNISVPEVADLLPNATLNGVNTQGENIADNGGLREAFFAYQKYVERAGEEPRLPGIDHFTPSQLFFLSNANIWCSTITKQGLLNQILTDPHSPGKYRVLVPMSNMEEFSTVWNCSSTAPMNPPNKCVVW
ncbi:neprilysin-1-like [Palaemon carinicauda]|uniref:neprilysin-1-like n=1 Tax=Palaemon carinicauda TaxID=392227 RepID=UPI0035B60D8B